MTNLKNLGSMLSVTGSNFEISVVRNVDVPEKLRNLIGNGAQARKGKEVYRQREMSRIQRNRGGKRTCDVPRSATLDECIEITKSIFFPGGKGPEGEENDMAFALGS